MNIAAIIIGIDGWEKYTLPLIQSLIELRDYPLPTVVVIDNASKTPYRREDIKFPQVKDCFVRLERSEERLCYSAAINLGYKYANEWNNAPYDPHLWYIVLSNDVLCTGPFAHMLSQFEDTDLVGPQLWHEHGLSWIYGYCVCISRKAWNDIGPWDENYLVSSVEDVDYSTMALEKGFALAECTDLPFKHLDQKQRFGLPEYAGTESKNWQYFRRKHGMA